MADLNLINIANYIRQNASADYQKKVSELQDGDPIVTLSNPILQYSTVKNEFAEGLINVIGETIINRIAKFENPLAKFKRGGKGLGIDTREIAKGLVSGFNYEFTTDGVAKMFKLYPQEYAECFHRLNRQRVFPLTFSEKEMKLAMQSWDDLEKFVNDLTETLYQSNYQEEYELMLQLIQSAVQNDGIKTIEITEVTDQSTGNAFIEVVKDVASSFNFRNASNSPWGAKNPTTKILPVCSKDDTALILPYKIKNKLSVSTLASAFNKDELAFNVDYVTEVDGLGYIKTGKTGSEKYYAIDAVICDKNFFRVIDDPDNEVNGNDLPTARAYNRYLHIWQTLSTSPFFCVNALVHEVQKSDVPVDYFSNLIERNTVVVTE